MWYLCSAAVGKFLLICQRLPVQESCTHGQSTYKAGRFGNKLKHRILIDLRGSHHYPLVFRFFDSNRANLIAFVGNGWFPITAWGNVVVTGKKSISILFFRGYQKGKFRKAQP